MTQESLRVPQAAPPRPRAARQTAGAVRIAGRIDTRDMDRCARPLTGQLRDLVYAALIQQGIPVRRLRWMGRHTNHLFRCDAATGGCLVVRVCLPGGRSDAELDAELAWLAALDRDTGLTVPVARFSTRAATAELPDGGRCIGFGWVQGRPCGG